MRTMKDMDKSTIGYSAAGISVLATFYNFYMYKQNVKKYHLKKNFGL